MSKLDTGLDRPLAPSGIKWGGSSHSQPQIKQSKKPTIKIHKYLSMRCCLTQVKLRKIEGQRSQISHKPLCSEGQTPGFMEKLTELKSIKTHPAFSYSHKLNSRKGNEPIRERIEELHKGYDS